MTKEVMNELGDYVRSDIMDAECPNRPDKEIYSGHRWLDKTTRCILCGERYPYFDQDGNHVE